MGPLAFGMAPFLFIAAVVLLCEWAARLVIRDVRNEYRKRVHHGSSRKAAKDTKSGKRGGKTKRGKPAKSTTFGVKAAAVTGAAVHGSWLAGKGIVQGWRSEWPNAKKRAHDRWARKHTPPEAKTPPPVDPRVTVKPAPEPTPKAPAQPRPNPAPPTTPPAGLNLSKPQQNGEPVATASKPTPGEVQSYEQVKSALKQIVADAGAEKDDAAAADVRLTAEISARGHLADQLNALKIDPQVVKNVSALRESATGWQQTAKARVAAAQRDLDTAQAALKALESSAQARFYQN